MHRVAAPVSISPGQGIWPGEMTLRHLQLPPDSARHREHGDDDDDDDDLAGQPWAAPLGDPGGSWSPSAAVSPVSALSLQRQSETSNVFLEFLVVYQGWRAGASRPATPGRCRASHAIRAHGYATSRSTWASRTRRPQHRHRPGRSRLRRHAEKTATATATRTRQPGTRHRRRPGPPSRRRRETAADRYGTSLRAPVARA